MRNLAIFGVFSLLGLTVACDGGDEICDDGTDNDGDGLVDEADPDCGGTSSCDTAEPYQAGYDKGWEEAQSQLDALEARIQALEQGGYATETWVAEQGYATEGEVASTYATITDLDALESELLDDIDSIWAAIDSLGAPTDQVEVASGTTNGTTFNIGPSGSHSGLYVLAAGAEDLSYVFGGQFLSVGAISDGGNSAYTLEVISSFGRTNYQWHYSVTPSITTSGQIQITWTDDDNAASSMYYSLIPVWAVGAS